MKPIRHVGLLRWKESEEKIFRKEENRRPRFKI